MFSKKKIILYGTIIFSLIGLSNGELYFIENPVWKKVLYTLLTVAQNLGIWIAGAYVASVLHRLRPGTANLKWRSVRYIPIISGAMILSFILFYIATSWGLQMKQMMYYLPWWYIVILLIVQSLFLGAAIMTVFEANLTFAALRRSEKEKDELQKANLQSRFDSLKGQVNPHFLFNSLNSLSSLIYKDPQRAEAFVEELSSVYRYLLRSNEQELITLKEEINFIHSFVHLLSTRFGENFRVQIDIYSGYNLYQLPPLTLQMLVENAVKHNIISKDEPLYLKIFTTPDAKLHIENNLQLKTREVSSNKVGLTNIIDRYKLLKQADVEVRDTGKAFIVTVPLIKPRES